MEKITTEANELEIPESESDTTQKEEEKEENKKRIFQRRSLIFF